jgi:hypothetical protein
VAGIGDQLGRPLSGVMLSGTVAIQQQIFTSLDSGGAYELKKLINGRDSPNFRQNENSSSTNQDFRLRIQSAEFC